MNRMVEDERAIVMEVVVAKVGALSSFLSQ